MASEEETQENQQNKEAAKRAKQIEKLNEYVQQMAYTPKTPPLASERTEIIAQPQKKNIVGTYEDHKDVLQPKERSQRVGRIASKFKTITAEQLEGFVQQLRKKQAKTDQQKKQQQILYHDTLAKLQKQCEEQLMHVLVNKFAKKVAKRASLLQPNNMETESFQCLQKSLVCYMYLTLQLPNNQQSSEPNIYNKLAAVMADLILQALFIAQNDDHHCTIEDPFPPTNDLPKNTETDHCIRLRALRAAKKKVLHNRRKGSRQGCSIFSHVYLK